MKGFGIYVKNDLLEPKHVKNMGEAVWLYMWLLDKITTVNENGEGKVLGNKPILYEEVEVDLGIHKNTYTKYLSRLREHGYVNTIRTPRGHVIIVTKAKKGITRTSDSHDRVIHTKKGSDSRDRVNAEDSSNRVNPIKTKQSRQNKTKQIHTSSQPTDELFMLLVEKLNYTNPNAVRFTDKRKRQLKMRLKTFSRDEIIKAADMIGNNAFLQGDNPNAQKYGDIDYLLRSDEQIDKQLQQNARKLNYKADW